MEEYTDFTRLGQGRTVVLDFSSTGKVNPREIKVSLERNLGVEISYRWGRMRTMSFFWTLELDREAVNKELDTIRKKHPYVHIKFKQ